LESADMNIIDGETFLESELINAEYNELVEAFAEL
jgi:hypothetical protein